MSLVWRRKAVTSSEKIGEGVWTDISVVRACVRRAGHKNQDHRETVRGIKQRQRIEDR